MQKWGVFNFLYLFLWEKTLETLNTFGVRGSLLQKSMMQSRPTAAVLNSEMQRAPVKTDSTRVQPSRCCKRWNGKWKSSSAELLHRREFTHSNEVASVPFEVTIKAEEGCQSLKRAKYIQDCFSGKWKHGLKTQQQWAIPYAQKAKWCRQHYIQICQSTGLALYAAISWGIFVPHQGRWMTWFFSLFFLDG